MGQALLLLAGEVLVKERLKYIPLPWKDVGED
jgi:hypothetical protein